MHYSEKRLENRQASGGASSGLSSGWNAGDILFHALPVSLNAVVPVVVQRKSSPEP